LELNFGADIANRGIIICDHGSEKGPRWGKIRFWDFGIFSCLLYQ